MKYYCNRCEQNIDTPDGSHWCTPKEILDAIFKK